MFYIYIYIVMQKLKLSLSTDAQASNMTWDNKTCSTVDHIHKELSLLEAELRI